MDSWKRSFLEKLHEAQAHCAKQFEQALDQVVQPVFEELSSFLHDNGFNVETPVAKPGRRSFKLELAENAYVLMFFRFSGVSDFELRTETFAPGVEPILEKSVGGVADIDRDWAQRLFQDGLDRFVARLADRKSAEPSVQPAVV